MPSAFAFWRMIMFIAIVSIGIPDESKHDNKSSMIRETMRVEIKSWNLGRHINLTSFNGAAYGAARFNHCDRNRVRFHTLFHLNQIDFVSLF